MFSITMYYYKLTICYLLYLITQKKKKNSKLKILFAGKLNTWLVNK